MSGGFCATMQGRRGIWRNGIMGRGMPRQLCSVLVECLENQGFARLGMRFYARFMPEWNEWVVAWLKWKSVLSGKGRDYV